MNMKKITAVLLVALSFGATAADKKASQPAIDARCSFWGHVAGFSEKELKPLAESAINNLDENNLYYEFGFAEGFLKAMTAMKGGSSRKEVAIYLYSSLCITAK